MQVSKSEPRFDSAGIIVSTLCALHCVFVPLAAGALAASGIAWLGDERYEPILIGCSLLLGLASLLPSYRRVHRDRRCMALFVLGMSIILIGKLSAERWALETPLVLAGATLIVSAHAVNYRLCKRCGNCQG
jgi:hypothetical protein